MKHTLLFLVGLFFIISCDEENESKKCPEDILCTMEFRTLTITVKDTHDELVALDSYKVIQVSDNKDITPSNELNSLQNGYYTMVTDGSLKKGETQEILFLGYVNNQEIIRSTYTVAHDCCHVSLVSGDTNIVVPENSLSCGGKAVIDGDLFANAPSDDLVINTVELNGNCLTMNYSASGCDGASWELKLIGSMATTRSIPPQRPIRLSLKNEELCEAFITREVRFDISDFQIEGMQKVVLNIEGYNSQIVYEY